MAPNNVGDVPSPPRRSSRRIKTEVKVIETKENEPAASKKPRKGKGKVTEETSNKSVDEATTTSNNTKGVAKKSSKKKSPSEKKEEERSPAKTENSAIEEPRSKRSRQTKTADDDKDDHADENTPSTEAKPKKKKAPSHQVLTEKDDIPRLWDPTKPPDGSISLKVASWNVAGLRAVIKKTPSALSDLVKKYDLDVVCLQETKLQEQHLSDPKIDIPRLDAEGYQSYFSCSSDKKGYSGTAVYVKKRFLQSAPKEAAKGKQPTIDSFFGAKLSSAKEKTLDAASTNIPVLNEISYKMGNEKHDSEGRLIILDFSTFTLVNVYVPNSGQNLARLSYRTDEWDKDFLAFMQGKQKVRGVPVLWVGDLNVAHTNLEVWNDGAKHLPKQAGVTPEERASFQAQLDAGFVDAFRRLHPTAAGHYSYWSTRAGNREPNKGLRLDYFVCDPTFFDDSSKVVARDSYMLDGVEGSDHCPVVLELEVRTAAN
ncbi:hypothetical protein ACA910_012734 [Epithemia clementina (nom. ined.)]